MIYLIYYLITKGYCFQYPNHQFSSVQSLSCVRLFVTPWIAAHQASMSITNCQSLPKPMSIDSVMPSSHLILCWPFSSRPQSFPASGYFQMSQLFTSEAKVLEFQLQHQSFQRTPRTDLLSDGLVGSLCSPRDSQESSPTPQFKSINSSALSLLYSPTLALYMTTEKMITLVSGSRRWT